MNLEKFFKAGVHFQNFSTEQLEKILDFEEILNLPEHQIIEKSSYLLSQLLVGNSADPLKEIQSLDGHDRKRIVQTWIEIVKDLENQKQFLTFFWILFNMKIPFKLKISGMDFKKFKDELGSIFGKGQPDGLSAEGDLIQIFDDYDENNEIVKIYLTMYILAGEPVKYYPNSNTDKDIVLDGLSVDDLGDSTNISSINFWIFIKAPSWSFFIMKFKYIVYKLTFPNGKIYIGKDIGAQGHSLRYFGSWDNELVEKDFTKEELSDFILRKQIIFESDNKNEVSKMEGIFIKEFNSNNESVGYNQTHRKIKKAP